MGIVSSAKRLYATVGRGVRYRGYAWGLAKRLRVSIGGRDVVFHAVGRSIVLMELATHGWRSFEPELLTLLESYPWPISRFVDAGANVGFFSTVCKLTMPHVKVVAVEPFPQNIKYMRTFQERNDVEYEVVGKALHQRAGEVLSLYFPSSGDDSGLACTPSLMKGFFEGPDRIYNVSFRQIDVETTTLSSVVGEGAGVLVKMDCEGAELDILKGSAELLARSDLDLVLEILNTANDKNDLFQFLRAQGYDGYLITSGGFVREDRPLTIPSSTDGAYLKNHFFTKKSPEQIKKASLEIYGDWI